MKQVRYGLTLAAVCSMCMPVYAITFFNKDKAGFDTAVSTASLQNLGTEDFESSTVATGDFGSVDDPLQPGVASSSIPANVFPNGTLVTTGMTIQSNNTGDDASNLSPHGTGGLSAVADGAAGTPTHQIGNEQPDDSLDFIFSLPTQAVGLNPVFALNNSVTSPNQFLGDVRIKVFDSSNTLIGTDTITSIGYGAEVANYFGIIAGPTEDIGRINLFATNGEFTGADNITVFGPAVAAPDSDGDGVPDDVDNCPAVPNPGQEDADNDGVGDVCDNAPSTPNPGQEDADGDGVGDVEDNAPNVPNPGQEDLDGDGLGDVVDNDIDGDGVDNGPDLNPLIADAIGAEANGPYNINVGDTLSLSGFGSFADHGITAFDWDLDNNGTFGDVTGEFPSVLFSTLTTLGADGIGLHTIGLEITDGNGQTRKDFADLNISAANNNPAVPEPTTAALAMLGIAGLVMRRRKAA